MVPIDSLADPSSHERGVCFASMYLCRIKWWRCARCLRPRLLDQKSSLQKDMAVCLRNRMNPGPRDLVMILYPAKCVLAYLLTFLGIR